MGTDSTSTDKTQFIVWKEAYNIGHDEIDSQHRNMVEIINDFYEANRNNDLNIHITSLMLRIYEYTQQHFEFEESLLEVYQYPNLNEHKSHHQKMEYTTLELKKKVFSGQFNAESIFAFLKKWWLDHILKNDKKYSNIFLKSLNIKQV